MNEKLFVSAMNYYPGKKNLKAGTVFTAEQWELAGGKPGSLEMHVKKGYITEAIQEVPETLVTETEPEVEESAIEEAEKTAPEGIWNFDMDQLVDLDLPVLNTIYKQRAEEFDLEVTPYDDKDALILKMCSEKA